MAGLLNQSRGGLLGGGFNPIRQIAAPAGQPMAQQAGAPSPYMAMGQGGGPPAYGSDAWALQGGGPSALFFRQIMRGMGGKNPLAFLDPAKASKFFTNDTIGILRPEFQQGFKKGNK